MLQKIIDDKLLADYNKPRERSGKFSPSQFGRCYRYQFWHRKNEPVTNPPEVRIIRKFKSGVLFHNFIQGLFEGQTEVKCEEDDVLGFADLVTEDSVIDIKTVHSGMYHYMTKSDYNIREREFNRWLQVAYYAKILKKPKISLFFVSKDDLCVREYFDTYSKWEGKLELELSLLRGFWKEDDLPEAKPRAYKDSKGVPKECAFCSYKNKCMEMF